MVAQIFALLEKIGYTHPVHPPLTHMVIGTTVAAFLLDVYARLTGRTAFLNSARHCATIALIFLPLTVLAGYLDWQHAYGGDWLGAIEAKIIAASVLLVVLIPAQYAYRRGWSWRAVLLLQTVAFLCVIALGYAGGELMY